VNTRYDDFETIVVDDGSTDGSLELVERMKKELPALSFITTHSNLGPAAGRNAGVDASTGRYVAFLDSDTEVDPQWLIDPVLTMERDPSVGVIQCKLLLMEERDKYDYAGDFLSQFGFLVQSVTFREHDDLKVGRTEIFGVKSAAMMINRELFLAIGRFDEDFFIYLEETDLCWRAWLRGYRVQFIPTSIVYHDFGNPLKLLKQSSKFLTKYHGPKNYMTTILKDAGGFYLVRIAPLHIFCWIGISLWHYARGRVREGLWISRGLSYNLLNFRSIWRKRLMTQYRIRRVEDNVIMPHVMVRISPMYLIRKATSEGSGWKI